MSEPLDFSVIGQNVVTGTSSQVAPSGIEYYAMQVIADAVVANMTFADGYDATGDWSDFSTIAAGATLTGRFNQLQLTSGGVILHYRRISS